MTSDNAMGTPGSTILGHATVISEAPQKSPEWLEVRRAGIGGSEISVLLGLNPYQTPLDLWQSKLTGSRRNENAPESWPLRRGNVLESALLAAWAEQNPGWTVLPGPVLPSIIAHPHHTTARCSLDGLATQARSVLVLEAKTAGRRAVGQWADGQIPAQYHAQVLWQLGITGHERAHVIADLAGDLETRVVEAQPEWFDAAVTIAEIWWTQHISQGRQPAPDPVRDASKLPGLWQPDTGAAAEIPAGLWHEFLAAKQRADEAELIASTLKARVQAAMGSAEVALVAGEPVATWRATTATRLDAKSLRQQHPDLCDTFCTTSTTRRFLVK